jgi:DNA-binding NtrC family response regulator
MTATRTASTPKPCVYIIDDDESVLMALKAVLSREYAVHTETRAFVAIEAIRKISPDVVVVDLKMPVRDGFWAFSEIRKFNPQVPIIINSAYQDIVPPDDIRDSFRPFATLQKGKSLATFINTVKQAAAQTALLRRTEA